MCVCFYLAENNQSPDWSKKVLLIKHWKQVFCMVKSGSMSLSQASLYLAFPILKSFFSNMVNKRTAICCRTGPSAVLIEAKEFYLSNWAVNMAKVWIGLTLHEFLDDVDKILILSNSHKDNHHGKNQFYAFVKSHQENSQRYPKQLASEWALVTPEKVQNRFKHLTDFMPGEVDSPSSMPFFNAYDSGFPLCSKCGKNFAQKDVSNIYNFTSSDKTQITVLARMNATQVSTPKLSFSECLSWQDDRY